MGNLIPSVSAGSILSSISGADSSLLPLQSQQSENQIKVASTHPTDLSRIPAEKIIKGHNASNFLEALTVFLHEHGCPMTPMVFDTFNLYWRLTVTLPSIPEARTKLWDLKNVVQAAPPMPAQGHHASKAACLFGFGTGTNW